MVRGNVVNNCYMFILNVVFGEDDSLI